MDIAKQQASDHDLLITLNVKVDSLVTGMKDLRDGVSDRISKLEARMKVSEDSHSGIEPIKEVEKLDDLLQWRRDVEQKWKLIAGIFTLIGSILAYLINILVNKYIV